MTSSTTTAPPSGHASGAASPVPPPAEEAPTSTGPTNLSISALASLSSRLFLSLLSSIPSSKTLILDPSLAGPLGLVVDTASLKSVGVERMFWMQEGASPRDAEDEARQEERVNVNAPTKAVVYVCRAEERWMRVIKSHINFDLYNAKSSSSGLAHDYHALLTPHRTELSLLSLSPNHLPHITLHDFGLELVPLDGDLLSLEEPSLAGWRPLYLEGDQTVLHRASMALMTCQMVWGCFPRISGKGDLSRRLADLLVRQRREHLVGDPGNPSLNGVSGLIDGLVIVERSTDLVTPLCNQLTYAGLVDDVIGIKSGHVEFDVAAAAGASGPSNTASSSSSPLVSPSSSSKGKPSTQAKKHRLSSSNDPLYSHIRDLNFSIVGSRLHGYAVRLSTSYEDRHSAKTVSEMRAFVGRLGGLQSEHGSLRLHTALTERLVRETNSETFNRCLEVQQNLVAGLEMGAQWDQIEQMVEQGLVGVETVLRLACLYCRVGGQLKAKQLEGFKRLVCQAYGYEQLVTMLRLEKLGMLYATAGPASSAATSAAASSSSSSSYFERVRQPLRLINDDVSESEPQDVAYVYSGYAPLSVRLVQAVGQKEALVGARAAGATTGATGGTKQKPRAHPLVGWRGFEDVLEAIPGETFDFAQQANPSSSNAGHHSADEDVTAPLDSANGTTSANGSRRPSASDSSPWSSADPDRPRTTMVFFIGGCTQAEVSALRFMGSQSRNRRWLVATTGMITGEEMMREVMPGKARVA
ncbi:Sec1-like protein [Jaminaea rosea]|uniref:Sec1-like protein n=1 Tax=Jaminaea rosea TaxID=1569628 RepID=A0A316UKY0_9BASI|nr:Sec1-like protein [Jaminaea rosea]PWN25926.1 Sec1-like protein [Jaminaea rosea]